MQEANSDLERKIAQLTQELSEARAQQTATADVLKVISRSAFDLDRVLETLVGSAISLCEATRGVIWLRKGEQLFLAAHVNYSDEWVKFAQASPITPAADALTTSGIAAFTGEIVHVEDVPNDPRFRSLAAHRLGDYRAGLAVPLKRDGRVEGVISLSRPEARLFTERQIALVQTFADQAVIAIENVRLFEEVQSRTTELATALQQQTATADVLKVISRSAFDLKTVLDALAATATRVCEADKGCIMRRDGDLYKFTANFGFSDALVEYATEHPLRAGSDSATARAAQEGRTVHIPDVLADPDYAASGYQKLAGYRTMLAVPLLREAAPIGVFILTRPEVKPFTQKQVELVESFADQAVIAMENVRLFEEVQARNREVTEALEQQTATGAILRVIAASPTDIQPVLQVVAESATRFCDTHDAIILLEEDGMLAIKAHFGPMPLDARPWPVARDWVTGRAFLDRETVHVHDLASAPEYPLGQKLALVTGHRTIVATPLMRDDKAIGALVIRRSEVRPFSERQIGLLKTFADQAVIAIENVRLFEEVQARTADLEEALTFQKATSDVLDVIGRSASKLQPVLDIIVETATSLCRADMSTLRLLKDGAFHHAASNNSSNAALAEYSRRNAVVPSRSSVVGRVALEGRTIHIHDVLADPEYTFLNKLGNSPVRTTLGVPLIHDATVVGVIVLLRKQVSPFSDRQIELVRTFADQAVIALANVQLFEKLETRTDDLTRSLDDLRTAQDRLVQTEKLASLGQLTAGIAHEIKNPLNFVNNFASLSGELIEELGEILADVPLDEKLREDVSELTGLLKGNLDKVVQHGKRADSIVRNMLLHSREGSGEHRPVDINAVVEESLNLAYHGARAEKQGFNITLERAFDAEAGDVDLYPQEMTRVLLNLISNGFYATVKRGAEANGTAYEPMLTASTRNLGDRVEIRIRDNGTGIPPDVKEKMFNPFFTTKPAGEGTGLGLSLSHDIIVKQHAGTIEVDTEPGAFTEFRIVLPRRAASLAKSGGQA